MSNEKQNVQIFMAPQEFPCGPKSSCCGPVGQSIEEIQRLKTAIEQETGCLVELFSVKDNEDMKNHTHILQLVASLGAKATPVIALNGEVVLMGNPNPEQVVSEIKKKVSSSI